MPPIITAVNLTRVSFINDFKRLPPDVREEATNRIAALTTTPIPGAYRFHSISGFKPNIYTIDVYPKKAYKASFNIINGVAHMRRIGTHKQIDRSP